MLHIYIYVFYLRNELTCLILKKYNLILLSTVLLLLLIAILVGVKNIIFWFERMRSGNFNWNIM